MDITEYRKLSPERLALLLAGRTDVDARHILQQVEGWQRLNRKVPSWTSVEGLEYPPRLSLEQCSGEEAARYKASIVRRLFPDGGKRMADITGGFGVDFSFLARTFQAAVYVERSEVLCRTARHNFPLLGLANAEVVCSDGVEYLKNMESMVDLLFLDPARRDGAGRKTVGIADCEPDVSALLPLLQAKARYTLVKLSPMLDISQAVRTLRCVSEVHVVAAGGECKELLLLLSATPCDEPAIYVKSGDAQFRFTAKDESETAVTYAEIPYSGVGQGGAETKNHDFIDESATLYLYEPDAAVLKAGAFRTVAARYGLQKLHANTHLYTADRLVRGFPGRAFRVVEVLGFGKQDVRHLRTSVDKANLSVRNFPARVDALRRKLKLRDGGDTYIFATTLHDDRHALLVCRKAVPPIPSAE